MLKFDSHSRSLRELIRVGWEVLKVTFLDCFFQLEQRDIKVMEFMNLKQSNMSVREYTLKLIKLLEYALLWWLILESI